MKKLSVSVFFSVIISLLFILPSLAAVHGDADLDGIVTTADARLALRMAVGLDSPPLYNADANADGVITEADARLLLRVALGMDSIETNHIFTDGTECIICGASNNAKPSLTAPLRVDGKVLQTGTKINDVRKILGDHAGADENFADITAYSFIKDGSYLVIAFTNNDTVFAYYVCGISVSLNGVSVNDIPANSSERFADGTQIKIFTDKNNGGKAYAFFVTNSTSPVSVDIDANRSFELTSRQIFDMTNAFRALYGLPSFKWNSSAADVSAAHSRDMADRNYFDHFTPENKSPSDRAKEYGISFYRYAENIAAGNSLPYETIDQWVNSAGHRMNMLGECEQLGVGGAYSAAATYRFYWTQNFLSQ